MPADELGAHADTAWAQEALLVQRLKVAVAADKIFVATVQDAYQRNLLGRQRLGAIGAEIEQAVARQDQLTLDAPAGARQFQQFLAAKTRDIHKVVTDAATDSEAKAGLLRSLIVRYTIGGAKRSSGFGGPQLGDEEPINKYEQALRDAGLLSGPSLGGYYKQWLENAERRGVPPEDVVEIARQQHITPDSFKVLDKMDEVKDPDGKSFFIIPKGTSPADMRNAVVMTYILNAGTDYGRALGEKDFEETEYSAAEVQRIADRQKANDWSYIGAARVIQGTGGNLVTTSNGMLMGLGGRV